MLARPPSTATPGGPAATAELATVLDGAALLFSASPELALVVTPEGDVLSANRLVPGIPVLRPVGVTVAACFSSPSAEALLAAHRRVAEARVAETLDAAGSSADGKRVYYQLSIAPLVLGDALVALLDVAMDVSARRAAEERLAASEDLMTDAQGIAHLGTWEWEVSQPHVRWSSELYRIYGLDPASYTPTYQAYLDKVHPEDRERVMLATERAFRDFEPYSHDERVFRPDGSMRYLHTWARAVVDDTGKLVKLIGVCQDITDSKLGEIALEERAAELARSNERLREEMAERERMTERLREMQKIEAIGRLAGSIAHDFNNVLAVVLGNGNLLRQSLPDGDPRQEYASEITTVARHAARLTQQLLAFSRGRPFRQEVLDLGRVVNDLSQVLMRSLGQGIVLSARVDDPAPYVEADRGQLEQVVMNLVVNARDAMPKGGDLTISVARWLPMGPDAFPDELDAHADYVVLKVSDSGVGMDAATLANVFEPYFSTKREGTGLGLATVQSIIRRCHGAVRVASTPGRGSTFFVYLPRVAGPSDERRTTPTPAETRALEPRSVLLVEDVAEVRRMTRRMLEGLNYGVFEAEGPLEALALVAQGEPAIDLLLTDLRLPLMNGVELAQRVKALRPTTRVLYVSGGDEEIEATLRGDLTGVVRKPFSSGELGKALRAAFAAKA